MGTKKKIKNHGRRSSARELEMMAELESVNNALQASEDRARRAEQEKPKALPAVSVRVSVEPSAPMPTPRPARVAESAVQLERLPTRKLRDMSKLARHILRNAVAEASNLAKVDNCPGDVLTLLGQALASCDEAIKIFSFYRCELSEQRQPNSADNHLKQQ